MEPLVAEAGFEVLTLEADPARHTLRLFIDKVGASVGPPTASEPDAEGGISVEDCARVSRLVSDWLDGDEACAPPGERAGDFWREGDYTLEVSSPGLDRPLCRPAHFCRFVGAEVALHAHPPVGDGSRRRVTGRLVAAAATADGDITLETEAGAVAIAYPRITRARLVPDLGPRAAKEPRHGRQP